MTRILMGKAERLYFAQYKTFNIQQVRRNQFAVSYKHRNVFDQCELGVSSCVFLLTNNGICAKCNSSR